MGIGESLLGFAGNLFTSNQNKKLAQKNRQQQMDFTSNLNWDPAYASDYVPTYQKAQSPVARSYLESLLLGNNPDTTLSGAPNAQYTKQAQQQSQNAMYGTPDDRAARARQLLEEQPWALQGRPGLSGANAGANASGPLSGAGAQDVFAARNPLLAQSGWTQSDLENLDKTMGKNVSFPDGMKAGDQTYNAGAVNTDAFLKLKQALDSGADKQTVGKLYMQAIMPSYHWK